MDFSDLAADTDEDVGYDVGDDEPKSQSSKRCPRTSCASAKGSWAWLDIDVCATRSPTPQGTQSLTSPRAVADLLFDLYYEVQSLQEKLVVLCLDSRNRPIAASTITIGTANQALAHPREVFRPALLLPTTGIIVAHNHPSGDPEPSAEDKELTARLKESGQILGVKLLDHIIVTPKLGVYYSFSEAEKR